MTQQHSPAVKQKDSAILWVLAIIALASAVILLIADYSYYFIIDIEYTYLPGKFQLLNRLAFLAAFVLVVICIANNYNRYLLAASMFMPIVQIVFIIMECIFDYGYTLIDFRSYYFSFSFYNTLITILALLLALGGILLLTVTSNRIAPIMMVSICMLTHLIVFVLRFVATIMDIAGGSILLDPYNIRAIIMAAANILSQIPLYICTLLIILRAPSASPVPTGVMPAGTMPAGSSFSGGFTQPVSQKQALKILGKQLRAGQITIDEYYARMDEVLGKR